MASVRATNDADVETRRSPRPLVGSDGLSSQAHGAVAWLAEWEAKEQYTVPLSSCRWAECVQWRALHCVAVLQMRWLCAVFHVRSLLRQCEIPGAAQAQTMATLSHWFTSYPSEIFFSCPYHPASHRSADLPLQHHAKLHQHRKGFNCPLNHQWTYSSPRNQEELYLCSVNILHNLDWSDFFSWRNSRGKKQKGELLWGQVKCTIPLKSCELG